MRASESQKSIVDGPKSRPIIGFIPEMRKDPLRFLTEVALKFPRLAQFKIGGQKIFLVSDPEYVRHILLDNFKNYEKLFAYDKLYPIFGKGLLTSNGDFWKRQRKLTQPAFHRERLQGFAKAMSDRTEAMLKRWESFASEKKCFELGDETRTITMDIVTKTMFGIDSSQASKMVAEAIEIILAFTYDQVFSTFGPLKNLLPTQRNRKFKQACTTMHNLIYSIIAERRKLNVDTGDLLSMYMQTADEETGEKMNDAQLKDEVMTIFFAGHETTAHTVSWVCSMLSKHPHVARKVDDELKRVLNDRTPTLEDLSQLTYLKMVIEETMRVLPVSWVMTRTAVADDTLGGHHIPAGATLFISEYVMHRLPQFWHNPEGFDPERFAPENKEKHQKFTYLPFGQGPRTCIGAGFAMMETQIILAMMLQKFHVDLVPGHPIELEPVMTLRPKNGVMVSLRKK